MKKIKFLWLDLDGTLLWKYHIITPQNLKALKDLNEQKFPYSFITGRDVSGALPFARLAKMNFKANYMVCLNGTKIWDLEKRQVIIEHKMPAQKIHHLINHLIANKWTVISYVNKGVISSRTGYLMNIFSKRILTKVKPIKDTHDYYQDTYKIFAVYISGILRKAKAKKNIEEVKNDFGRQFEIVRTSSFSIEITPKGVSKATGLREVGKLINVRPIDMAYIGDSGNDIPPLKIVGTKVAMGNAHEEVKDIAHHITDSNKKNGVAKYIHKMLAEKNNH